MMVERIWKSKARAREEDSQWKASEGSVEDGEPGTGESRVDKGRGRRWLNSRMDKRREDVR